MSYINRFTFKRSITFKFLERGFNYLDKIEKVVIDGNIVTAEITGTEKYYVSCDVDFVNRKLNNFHCTCPYIKDGHKHCKHMAALMLYLDIYINGGYIKDLFVHLVAHSIIGVIKKLNELSASCKYNDIERAIVGKRLNFFDEGVNINHAIPSFKEIESISLESFSKAFNLLMLKKNIAVDRNKNVYLTGKQYNDAYNKFYSKYSFLVDEDDYEDYKDDDEFRNDSFGNIYYHGEQQIEVVRGVNLIHCCEYFNALNDFTKTGFKIIYDKTMQDFLLVDKDDDEYSSLDDFNEIEVIKEKPSIHFYEYFINSIKDDAEKNYLRNNYIDGKINLNSFSDLLSKNEIKKFQNYTKNYFIGKALEFAIANSIDFWFERPLDTSDDDYFY